MAKLSDELKVALEGVLRAYVPKDQEVPADLVDEVVATAVVTTSAWLISTPDLRTKMYDAMVESGPKMANALVALAVEVRGGTAYEEPASV